MIMNNNMIIARFIILYPLIFFVPWCGGFWDEFPCDYSGFKDRTVDVKEYTTGKSDVKYFVHVIKTRAVEDISPHLEDISHLESQALSSSLAEVQKKKQLPLAPSISASSSQTEFKGLCTDFIFLFRCSLTHWPPGTRYLVPNFVGLMKMLVVNMLKVGKMLGILLLDNWP